MDYAIETVALCKRFVSQRGFGALLKGRSAGTHAAVDRVSFSVHHGEVFGLLGPNGAGKTTLMKLLCTLLMPTAGIARVGGYDVAEQPAEVRRLVGLVTSNERSFYWRLTGRQNLSFFAELYTFAHADMAVWIEELLDALGLREYADQRFDSYSTGIRQRFALARALLHRPRILFMDEPTKGLDPTAVVALIRLLQERVIAIWRPAILMTSHNLAEIGQLCNRIAIMRSGRFLYCGCLDELRHRIFPYHTYHLRLGGLPTGVLRTIAACHGVKGMQTAQHHGLIDLEVQFSGGNGTLSAILRTLLNQGGEVYQCTEACVSLEDIFSHVVSSPTED